MLFRLGLVFLLQKSAVNALKLSVLSARCLVWGVFVATSTAMRAKEEKHNEKDRPATSVCLLCGCSLQIAAVWEENRRKFLVRSVFFSKTVGFSEASGES